MHTYTVLHCTDLYCTVLQVMKDEMALVQGMEVAEDRDSEQYADRLQQLLTTKQQAVQALRTELSRFRSYRTRSVDS